MHRVSLVVILVLLLLAGALFGLNGVSFAVDSIIPGVHVGPVDLGGLTLEDAGDKLKELAGEMEVLPVRVNYNANIRQIPAGELGVKLDIDQSLEEARQVGNTGSIFRRLAERRLVERRGMYIKPALVLDRQQLENKAAQVWQNIIKEPENAGFKVLPDDTVTIVPGRMGTSIDIDALGKEIIRKIVDHHSGLVEVDLPVLTVEPYRTTRDIESMEINGLIAQYSTRFDSGQAGRTYNIKVAAAALDGLLIAPGEEFSFNRVVGPRSSEAGYKRANVIVNNELVEGLGGGVCQVSSTLYNAVLLANLKIVERSNHSLPVSYVPIGRDATVVYGAVDFKFSNNTDFYIYIRSIVSGNTLTVKLYGNKEKTPRVELSSWVTQTIEPTVKYENDPNLAEGEKVVKQEGTNGYKAAAVRYIWKDGEKVEEILPSSYYQPVRRIIAVGTGAASPTVVVPLEQDLIPPVVPAEPETPEPQEGEKLTPEEEEEEEEQLPPDVNEKEAELLTPPDNEQDVPNEKPSTGDETIENETLPTGVHVEPDEPQPIPEGQEENVQDN